MSSKVRLLYVSILSMLFSLLLLGSVSAASLTNVSKKAVIGDNFVIQLKGATGTFNWRNSNAGVATIIKTTQANAVRVIARSKGTTTVTIVHNNRLYSCKVKVYNPNFGISSDKYMKKGSSLKINPKNGYGKRTVKSSNSKILKVSKKSGKFIVKAKRVGTATIKVKYCGRTKKYKVTVAAKKVAKKKIAVAIGDASGVNAAVKMLKKYGNVTPVTVDTNVNANDYVGLIVPTGNGNVDPLWYKEYNIGYSVGVNHALDSRQLTIISRFLGANKPILGLGKGMHLINIASGGSLNQASGAHRNALVKNNIVAGSFFNSALGSTVYTICNHNQTIKKLGNGLRATVYAADGVIEGIEGTSRRIYGLQWDTGRLTINEEKVIKKFVNVCLG